MADDPSTAAPDRRDRDVRMVEPAAAGIDDAALVDVWTREAGLSLDMARQRLSEVLLVAVDAQGELVGISTAYLQRNEQLGLTMWYFRAFVRAPYRGGATALRLARTGRDLLADRFASGQDDRAPGMIFEVQHRGLQRRFDHAVWPRTGFVYLGQDQRGVPVRVFFFPGRARAGAAGVSGFTVATTADTGDGELLGFLTAHGIDAGVARARLPEVVGVVRDDAGEVAGASFATESALELVGGRRLWVVRALLAPAADADTGVRRQVERVTHATLESRFGGGDEPLGTCLLLTPNEAAARPEAVWSDPHTVHAGGLPDGRQVRVAWFRDASVEPGRPPGKQDVWDLEAGPRIVRFAGQDEVGVDAIVELWVGEGVLSIEEARRRVGELHMVAIEEDGAVAGVSSTFLALNAQLGVPMWHYRAFVGEAHRRTSTAARLAVRGREALEEDFLSGRDVRAPGILYEVENAALKALLPQARWLPTDFTFIGENARGDHVRVHWFPGAPAPVPHGST
jgi:hypothetical protein